MHPVPTPCFDRLDRALPSARLFSLRVLVLTADGPEASSNEVEGLFCLVAQISLRNNVRKMHACTHAAGLPRVLPRASAKNPPSQPLKGFF